MLVVFDVLHVSDRSSQRSSVSDDHGGVPSTVPKSESIMSHKAHKLRFVPSVEFRHSSGNSIKSLCTDQLVGFCSILIYKCCTKINK